MKKLVFVPIIGIITIGIGILLFTNIDELTFSVIDKSLEKVEVDTSTFNRITNTFPVTSRCDYTLIYIESYYRPTLGDHTEWYYQNLGDVLDEYKKDFNNLSEKGTVWNSPEFNKIQQKYIEKIKTRINPVLFDEFPFSKPPSGESFIVIPSKYLEDDLECAAILETNYKNYIHVIDDDEYQKLIQSIEHAKTSPSPEKIIEQKQYDPIAFQAEKICDAQTTSSSDCALVLEQATIELQNVDKKLEKAEKRWKDICRGAVTGSCYQEFFVVQEATKNYLDKNEKMLLIYYSTDERLVEFGQLVREYTLWSQFCESVYSTDTMCDDIEIIGKKLDEFNFVTMNECADNHNDVCDKRILSIFALCTTTPLFENMEICSNPKFKNYVENSDFPT